MFHDEENTSLDLEDSNNGGSMGCKQKLHRAPLSQDKACQIEAMLMCLTGRPGGCPGHQRE